MTNLRRNLYAATTAVALAVGSLTALTGPAEAQELCLIRDDAIDNLAKQYGEEIAGRGLSGDGQAMVELLTGQNGNWTIVITDVNGRSCVIGTGEAWTAVEPQRGVQS